MDIPGHFCFRDTIKESLPLAKALVIVLDSKDKERFSEAAEILYDVLSDVDLVTARVPVLVACNKQDLTFAKKAAQVERDMISEIEQIRKVRRAGQEQETDPSGATEPTSLGYLESL